MRPTRRTLCLTEFSVASSIPLISIIEAAYAAAKAAGLTRVGLLGTRFTMQGNAYPSVFTARGITLVAPDDADQEYVHAKYVDELVKADYRPDTRDGVLAVIDRLRQRHGIDGVILGGTELPLLLRGVGDVGVPLLDTGKIHVKAAVDRMFA